MAQKDHFLTCECCGKDYFGYGWSKYCSQGCQDKAHQVQNNLSAKARRIKSKVCKTCGIEFSTSSNAKHCEDCFRKLYYCECGELKTTPEATKCTKCLNTKTCEICGKSFISKSHKVVCCSTECKKKRKCELRKDREGRHTNCVECGSQMEKRQGLLLYCESCSKKRSTCPDCGGEKKYSCARCKSCNMKDKRRDEERSQGFRKHLDNLMRGAYGRGNNTKPNLYRESFFKEHGVEYEREFRIDNNLQDSDRVCFIYDFKVGKFLIDINPTWTHSSSHGYRGSSKKKDEKYHYDKTTVAENAGYHCIHIFDWDYTDKVKQWLLGLLKGRKRLYASTIKEIPSDIAMKFCKDNHLQGKAPSTVWYGLYKGDLLINVMGFMYFPKKEEWHLTRFASLSGFYVAHGAEKLFRAFVQKYDPAIVVSYSDRTKHSGILYNKLGFSTERIDKPSYRWVDMKTNIPYRRRNCQKKSMHLLPHFDKDYKYAEHKEDEFWLQTEDQIMISKGYTKICDSGNRRHIRRKSF